MSDEPRTPGTTTIAPGVLLQIARLTTLNVDGVNRLGHGPSGVNRLFQRNQSEGVRLDIEDGIVNLDLYVVLNHNTSVREVCKNIQLEVTRAITEMVGVPVGKVNIQVEDIAFPNPED